MQIIEDVIIRELLYHNDSRGYFTESFRQSDWKNIIFVQENESFSKKGTFRGLHLNILVPQSKFVRVITGHTLTILYDLRPEKSTYRNVMTIELTKGIQVFVPKGVAHGFLALEDTIYTYLCDSYYQKAGEMGISYLDPKVFPSIEKYQEKYHIPELIISEKDQLLPTFEHYAP